MIKKKKLILRYFILSIIAFLLIDLLWSCFKVEKEFIFNNQSDKTNIDDFAEEKLQENDKFLYFFRCGVINRKSDIINFFLWIKEKKNVLRIQDLEFQYDDYSIKIEKNLEYILYTDNPNNFSIVQFNLNNVKTNIYNYNIYSDYYRYKHKEFKINFNKIFSKKKAKIGDKFPVKVIIHYYLDDEEYYQELDFLCECVEKVNPCPPNWFMFFFPGAY